MLRLTASDPLYPAWNWLMSRYAEAVNPHVAWDTRWMGELPDAERKATLAELSDALREAWEELSR